MMTEPGASVFSGRIRTALGGLGRWSLALAILCVIGGCARSPQYNRIQGMMFEPAREAERIGDYERAFEIYKDVAEDGVVIAQTKVAQYYEKGQGTPQNYAEAARWYEAAAKAGDPRAYGPLARLYETGNGVPQDDARALQLYLEAAATGTVWANAKVGQFLEKGRGGTADPAAAARYYQIAAEAGDQNAQLALADLYRKGNGIAADPEAAKRWYAEAARRRDRQSGRRRCPRAGSSRPALSRRHGRAEGPRGGAQLAQYRGAQGPPALAVQARAAVRARHA